MTTETRHRTWFLRGANDNGVNRVPDWLANDYVSIGWADSAFARPGMSFDELREALRRGVPGIDDAGAGRGAGNLDRFFHQMNEGDLVVTVDGSAIYVGRLAGGPERRSTDEADQGAFWRRRTEWLNAVVPFDRATLPQALQTSLKTQGTLTDLTKHAALVHRLVARDGWEDFVHWAERLYKRATFDAEERDYKLEIAEKLRAARAGLETEEWLELLRAALGPPNNLTHWQWENKPFLEWCASDPEAAREFLRALWERDREAVLRGSLNAIPAHVLAGRAARTSLASLLLMAIDVYELPIFRSSAYTKACELVGRAVVDRSAKAAELYRDFLLLLDELSDHLRGRGITLRDRLDAQSLLWWVTTGDPPDDWSEVDKEAFLAFRGEVDETPRPTALLLPAANLFDVPLATPELSQRLLLPQRWLQEIVDLLNEKRQVIFYGPPGTGKTYVAQALGDHVAGAGGAYELVQFHPAYSYEDFFEGFRPAATREGVGVAFELRHGPLRRIAARAAADPDHPYLLVVDEINRGNVAKIFGELFFLLEYRNREIPLQYSPDEPFALPSNLYIVGTMNTADRSIALVDTALRRRFYFVPFIPTKTPLKEVLRKWLAREGLNTEPAELLERLNAAIGADEFAIGPSYFMGARGPDGIDLERVWRFSIRPLLEEHYYGTGRNVDDFSFDVLRTREEPVELPVEETAEEYLADES